MSRKSFIVAKENSNNEWSSFSLPGGRSVVLMPRAHFVQACAAADKKMREAVADIRHKTQSLFQGDKHGL